MSRTSSLQLPPTREKKMLDYFPEKPANPSAIEMEEFASQFSKNEWEQLCQDTAFLDALDKDLRSAGACASLLLKRHVFIWV